MQEGIGYTVAALAIIFRASVGFLRNIELKRLKRLVVVHRACRRTEEMETIARDVKQQKTQA